MLPSVGDAITRSYAQKAGRHIADRDADRRRSALIARLRLATSLPAAAVLGWAFARGVTPGRLVLGAVLLAIFGVLVAWHAIVENRMAWHNALRLVCERGVAREARDWSALPPGDPPDGIDLSGHPYASDLDVFGRASLFQWLGPAATVSGSATLANWLLAAASPAEIADRQRSVAALAPLDEWRERFAAHGLIASGARRHDIDRFLGWAEGAVPPFGGGYVYGIAVVLTMAIWVLIALNVMVIDAAFWLTPMLLGIVLSFVFSGRVSKTLDLAGGGQRGLARYGALFEHAVSASASSPRLATLRERLSSDGASAPDCMRQLNRILGFGDLRKGAAIFHFPIQALTLWDFHVLFALERWRRRNGHRVRDWLAALADMDALAALATAGFDNPAWCVPEMSDEPLIEAESIGHPLIADARRVTNDVSVGPPGTVLLVTGSNMSGKSTLLRAIGLNIVLAQAGASACATRFRLPPSDLQTSIRIQDSLEAGLSYFMAALARLKGVVDAAEHERKGRVLVYLLDEILQGTNSAERATAVRAVARHLLQAGAIGAMTTHDLTIAGEEPLAEAARLVHFTETVDEDGTMRFDYRLRPGLATSRNALRLMKLIGIEL
jgi:MutS domain V